MPPKPTAIQTQLKNITTCLTITANTLDMLVNNLHVPFLTAISNMTQSLLKCIQTVKQNKSDCTDLMEKTHTLLNAIIIAYIKSDTGTDLPPLMLKHIGRFTEYLNLTLHKIHTFVDAQQDSSTVKRFFHRGEMSTLLHNCKIGLQHALEFFQTHTVNIMTDITKIEENAQKRHREVLDMIEALSEATSSDGASTVRKIHCFWRIPIILFQMSRLYSGSHNSSNSISMLPSEPKIFHGRESEISEILRAFSQATPRIAILGAGGMGKTSLARAVIHHTDVRVKYEQHRFFVACDSAATKVELAALVGAHLGLKPGKDLTQPITMRGAERPAKVAWTRPFLQPLKPLDQDAARDTFIDIADNRNNLEEVDKVLSLTDNMPLAISLIANLADSEGCTTVLARWAEEKTSLISEGFDKRSNLDLSISLSLSSPRIESLPDSRNLLSLLSMLPDGLSDAELVQSNLPIGDILGCKVALIRTSLVYTDEQKRLKVLVPIREYVQKIHPPGDHLVQPLLKHFQELLELYVDTYGAQSTSTIVTQISSNFSNIQNILQNRLQLDQINLRDTIYCICNLAQFSRHNGQGSIPLFVQVHNMLPHLHDPHLEIYFITELLASFRHYLVSNISISCYSKKIGQVHDTDLKCRFYICVADYYKFHKRDLSNAISFSHMAISLADSTGNTRRHSQALYNFARLKWSVGDYSASQLYAHESQRLARISAEPSREALALTHEALCVYTLGDYKQSISLFNRARSLLGLCGASGSEMEHQIISSQAQVHMLKSEYVEARNIHSELQEVSKTQDLYHHALALLNIAEINVAIGTPTQIVQRDIQTARKIFSTRELHMEVMMCETTLADLYLREGNIQAAEKLLKKAIRSTTTHPQIIPYCLERLGDVTRWNVSPCPLSWTTVYFVHALKFKERLAIHKVLQFLGDIFLSYNNDETSISLYTVALEGFTQMDVHRSRAECMLHLGDISKGRGDLLKALELWETARPLFERSSQAKQVDNIDGRLASVGEDVLEQHRKNLAHLAEINAPSGDVEELEDNLSDIEDPEVDLYTLQNLSPVTI
ncbi:hypothetical protein B0H13DRAFT_1916540 [Mycena leptocephala]|nr:hypothetical protein B0H13DRAFT_1916540 [Mycena leptocephala]